MGDRGSHRHYRRKDEDGGTSGAAAPKSALQLEAEALARIGEAVASRLEAALVSEAFKERVAGRLKEERARLEAAMLEQLEVERAVLLERKRAAREAALKAQEDLDRLLEENRRALGGGKAAPLGAWDGAARQRQMTHKMPMQLATV
ncbi:hypothetical protein MNEG_3935 [Monoraphidium neglectum]|uniref:Uncharacterized protein n=1 Tax=Monoraphidium neglectum TaxID=145388 RepID=A0A0D2MU32_9CHLO|nr:hypothetical protein MNEG_3935 [Monoraphidium neglectum]KIZ04022.1 hypothetical protein MNEG_3935 [Monoraphidium neglectum]|eukprot:XP_013903041.1 hypothetical protein MNEG_3935 [Monoraphidium neglectum]